MPDLEFIEYAAREKLKQSKIADFETAERLFREAKLLISLLISK
jgi:hypothetical protein